MKFTILVRIWKMDKQEVACLNYPKLKNSLLCTIVLCVLLVGGFIAPIVIAVSLTFLSEAARVFIMMGGLLVFLIYLIKSFPVLTVMEGLLATLSCHNTARKRFVLPQSFSVQKVERKISHFGTEYEPLTSSPRPVMLRYQSKAPLTIWSSGIEKVIAAYHVDFLDKNQYRLIFHSAKANSNVLKGKKKHLFLDKAQKRAPLNRVTVIVIYAKQVEEELRDCLFDMVRKNGEAGLDTAVLPCVVDLEKGNCTFDSLQIPYFGTQYPAKNRGIKLIRKYLFDNKFPFSDSPDMLDPVIMEGLTPEQSLWEAWRFVKKEMLGWREKGKKRFQEMRHRDIVLEDGLLCVKWNDRGVVIPVQQNDELKTIEIDFDAIGFWDYPKRNKIAKDTVREIQALVDAYFSGLGYTTKYN